MKTVLITGVNGFLGAHLARALALRGWRVRGTTRSAAGINKNIEGVAEKMVLDLARPAAGLIFTGVDAVIHCAYDLRREAMEQNIAGTKAAAEAATAAGVAQQIFISSYSAHAEAGSAYGRSKYLLQEYFLARGGAVARPGLVIGPGGLYARLAGALRLPVVPLADGGRDRVPVVALRDFINALAAVLEKRRTGLFNLYHPRLVTLRDLIAAVRMASGSRALLLPVPASVLIAAVRLAGSAGVALPFDAENFLALRANRKIADASDLPQFIAGPAALAEMVAAATAELSGQGGA
ncbi:MAG TPA: NAD(P)-dependent oxidoreductase [Verrucomicrobiae bacterium]|nr:NAD(P)-dependent oxidoreductase [Verrucomicrobiae bacterium]